MPTRVAVGMFCCVLMISGCKSSFYDGFSDDVKLLRDQYWSPNPPLNASSRRALEAAHRVFTKVNFVGMSKERVLSLLGDPATISDYGKKAEPGPDKPLIYNFDTGVCGVEYTLNFRDGRCTSVDARGFS